MVQASVFAELMATFKAGAVEVLPVLVDALLEGVEGQEGLFSQVMTRATKHRGVVHPSEPVANSYAIVVPGKSVTLIGTRTESEATRADNGLYRHRLVEKPYVRTYEIGSVAEYDSYNLSYYGEVVGIGAKTVTIDKENSGRVARLDLHTFSWRNSRFDLAKAQARNHDHAMYG